MYPTFYYRMNLVSAVPVCVMLFVIIWALLLVDAEQVPINESNILIDDIFLSTCLGSDSTQPLSSTSQGAPNEEQDHNEPLPNIIMIVIDDLGSNDIGYHNSGIHTPNIDNMIYDHDGLLLTNYYVLPYCSSTRAAILSGRYPLHTGCHTIIKGMDTQGLPIEEIIIPQILRSQPQPQSQQHEHLSTTNAKIQHQYHTHAIGKWHIGHSMYEQLPTYRGFQSFFGYYRGWGDYYTHYTSDSKSKVEAYDLHYDSHEFCNHTCSQYVDERGNYSTHVFTREAIRILHDHYDTNIRHKNVTEQEPLFLYLAYQAVHAPEEVPEKYSLIYTNQTSWSKQRQIYAGMLSAVDEAIGNITRTMQQELGDAIWNNTIFILTTDNGGPTGICAVQGSMNKIPRRGGKCTIWEGGTTGDAIISGPYFQRKRQAARQQHQEQNNNSDTNNTTKGQLHEYPYLFHAVDWLPTIAAIAGIQPNVTKPIDGVNHWDVLLKYDPQQRVSFSPPPREEVFVGYASFNNTWYGPAIRWNKWKLLQGTSGGPEKSNHVYPDYIVPIGSKEPSIGGNINDTYQLYNIENDPGERIDVSNDYPDIVLYLQKKLQYYQQTYVPPIENYDNTISCNIGPYSGISYTKEFGPISHPWCKKIVIYE